VARIRRRWQRRQGALDPARLVLIDESAAKTNLTRWRGRATKGKRLVCRAPHGHWRTTTTIFLVHLDGTRACMTTEGATDHAVFQAYVREVLVPVLRTDDIIIMDNLGAPKNDRTLALIAQAGAEVRFLTAYSPDLNSIEMMWSKVKSLLRKAEARTHDDLLRPIVAALRAVTPQDALGWFAACGYSFI